MSDRDEYDDDPDGVTLWSGRLRASPVASDADGEDTVRTRRTPGGVASRASDHGETAPADGDAAFSGTVPRDDPPPSPADDRSPSALADVTGSPVPDDDTAPSRSRTPRARSERSTPRNASANPAEIDEGVPASEVDTSTAPRAGVEPRVSASVADTEVDSRPRGIRPAVPVVDGGSPSEREARSPVPLQRESYAPRADEPARVVRSSADDAIRSGDAGLIHPRRSPGRAHLLVLAAALVAVVVIAAVGVALLLG